MKKNIAGLITALLAFSFALASPVLASGLCKRRRSGPFRRFLKPRRHGGRGGPYKRQLF